MGSQGSFGGASGSAVREGVTGYPLAQGPGLANAAVRKRLPRARDITAPDGEVDLGR